jgi:magnesium chelatase subunit D
MSRADDAAVVASLLAVDPVAVGGVCLRSQVHPLRDQWLRLLRELLPPGAPLRRVPFNIADGRLLGGLDLAATLRANRPIAERGALADSDGGVVVISMAERLTVHSAACLAGVLDAGAVEVSREGVCLRHEARLGIVALDEGIGDEERTPRCLLDRLAFLLDLEGLDLRSPLWPAHEPEQIAAARELLAQVQMSEAMIEALCATALALGAGSPRVSLLACRAARIAAALQGRRSVLEEDTILAGRLVLAPRATTLPRSQEPESKDDAPPPPEESESASPDPPPSGDPDSRERLEEMESRVLDAAQAAIPQGLLARIVAGAATPRKARDGSGRSGALRSAGGRGRPGGVRSGTPNGQARLNVIETLRAAAPWQRVRGRIPGSRVCIRATDFRVTHCKQPTRTLTIFAVDASGSSALHRLAEAKGAVELLLAECYIRRDQVAVIAFRGRAAELLLPPTRSLLRAKRGLAGLPGGGATPLAAAIDAAAALAAQAQRRGETPVLVILTDGRANIARNGAAGREAARLDALAAARAARSLSLKALLVDTSSRPSAVAEELAAAMNARYVPLPYFNSRALSETVKAAASS